MRVRLALTVLTAALGGCSPLSDRSRTALEASGDLVALSGGDAGAAAACFLCHGLDGRGDGDTTPRLAGLDQGYLQKQLGDYASGVRADPVMGPIAKKLSEKARSEVAAHYATLAAPGAPSGARAPAIYVHGDPRRGVAACADCHGASGEGVGLGNPALAGQPPAYTRDQLSRFADAERRNDARGIMRTAAAALTAAERASIAAWLGSQASVPGRAISESGATLRLAAPE